MKEWTSMGATMGTEWVDPHCYASACLTASDYLFHSLSYA
jgi:hypothetical protein